MARSRRATGKRFTAKRKRLDWVYRSRTYLLDGSTASLPIGSYSSVETTITPGAANSVVFNLLDSHIYMSNVMSPNNAFGDSAFISRAGSPEKRGYVVRAVQGVMFIRPSAWAVGNVMSGGYRLTIGEQDVDDGLLELDADYSIMIPAAAPVPANDPVLFANQPGTLKTWYVYRAFSDNSSIIKLNIFWKGRRRLRPEEGLFMHVEVNGPATGGISSVNHIVTPKLRTLVEAE